MARGSAQMHLAGHSRLAPTRTGKRSETDFRRNSIIGSKEPELQADKVPEMRHYFMVMLGIAV